MPEPWTVPSWSRDGKQPAITGSSVSFADAGGSAIDIINADGSGLSAVPGVTGARDAAWRPEKSGPPLSSRHVLRLAGKESPDFGEDNTVLRLQNEVGRRLIRRRHLTATFIRRGATGETDPRVGLCALWGPAPRECD